MNRLPEESEAGPSRINEEGIQLPPLNLTLTITPEFIRSIDSMIICPHQPLNLTHQQNPNYTTPQQNLTPEKQKAKPKAAMHFPISEITIGEWTHKSKYQDDFKAKIYFKKRRLIWEILDDVQIETQVSRLKRKIEIQWSDILSFRTTCNPSAQRETLDVELKNRPTFFMETNPQEDKHTQWKETEDFTLNQSASKFRRHTLHCLPGDLQQNLDQLVSGDNFWSTLARNRFPTLQHSIHFDVGYGDRNNNPTIQEVGETSNAGELRGSQSFAQDTQPNSMIYPNGLDDWQCLYGWMDDICMDDICMDGTNLEDINMDDINSLLNNEGMNIPNYYAPDNHQVETMSQIRGKQVTQLIYGGMNSTVSHFNGLTIYEVGETSKTGELRGRQNSLDQDNQQIETMGCQLPGTQVTHSSSQLNNEGMNITMPPLNIPMIQEEGETSKTGELRGSQVFAQDTQPNSMIYPNGLDDWLCLDGWPQNLDDINLDDDCWKECSLPSL